MGHYKSNLRDIEFALFEVLERDRLFGQHGYDEVDLDTARALLAEVDRLARADLAASYEDGDRNPPVYDPETRSVTIPDSFRKSYQALVDAELWRAVTPKELGGTPIPPSLYWAAAELILGSNAATWMYATGPSFARVIWNNGTPEQKRIAEIMIDRGWGGTMVLTEPDAGSDVGAGRTKAHPQPDGSWHIEGVKRFITSGEHDLTENIIHLVLARPVGVDGAGGPGTKGLSMFIVPKYRFDLETGELGERNGVYATNVEKKMGLKVSSTCELTFGDGEPAVGYLVGGVHDGIAQMFQVIEAARMQLGVKAIATLSTGYLTALDYARNRVQGPDLTRRTDRTAPKVTIDRHPDVRRMLMLQKAYAEGLRAVYLYTADWLDRANLARHQGADDTLPRSVNDLLLPIVKGVGSERAYEMLTLSLQTLGGSGFLQDYPIEQYIRDTKIDSLYEGTTGIQSMDFFFRKIARDRSVAFGVVSAEIDEFLTTIESDDALKFEHDALAEGLTHVRAMVDTMREWDGAAAARPEEIYKVGQNTTRLLMSVGDLLVGWLLARQAVAARRALNAAPTDPDADFYTGKVAVSRFFATTVLPELAVRRRVLEQTDDALMDMPGAAF